MSSTDPKQTTGSSTFIQHNRSISEIKLRAKTESSVEIWKLKANKQKKAGYTKMLYNKNKKG